MSEHELGFGKIIVLRDDIAEVIFDEGALLTPDMVDLYHHTLSTLLREPFSLLINKKHHYSYDLTAAWKLGTFQKVKAFAFVAYDERSRVQAGNITFLLPRDKLWNVRFFSDREEALQWLHAEQASVKH